jgi:2-iminobutanoate/2-iminopropanoate deaminase
MKYGISSVGMPDAYGPYSQGTTAGRLVFTSGQVAYDPDDASRLLDGDVSQQTERILDIVEDILSRVDCTLSDVAQVTVFLVALSDADAMNEVFAHRFGTPAPACSVIEVSALPMGALVEMDCVACR